MTIADVIAAFAAAASARNRHLQAQAWLERACERRHALPALLLAPLVVVLRNRADRIEAAAERMLLTALGQQSRTWPPVPATATSMAAAPSPPASAPDSGAAHRA